MSVETQSPAAVAEDSGVRAVIGERLSLEAFLQISGNLAGYPFVKVIVDRANREVPVVHFINNARYKFHSDYIAENFLGVTPEDLDSRIDEFNRSVYLDPSRRFMLGVIAYQLKGERFFTLETVEIDNMDQEMVLYFYRAVKNHLDMELAVLFKPANHIQEAIATSTDPAQLPRVYARELFASEDFVALNPGTARGRLRAFRSEAEYRKAWHTLDWYDIIVMDRVPEDIPRLSGIINVQHTTPLSHTNVLASGWQVPNAIQLGIWNRIDREQLDGKWVSYSVELTGTGIDLLAIARPEEVNTRPAWSVHNVKIEAPETVNTPIAVLDSLRMSDRYRYGTKAANIGELRYLLDRGSERLLGFYKIRRPPRSNLLPHVAKLFGLPENSEPASLSRAAWDFLKANVQIPRGIALPFSIQQEFLESSPRIQQMVGRLKMAIELNAKEVDSICLNLQNMIRATRIPERLRDTIDAQIASHLAGVSSFVVRSSSNAEDLDGFSAAGIYESINHVTTSENVFQSIKEVWASLLSPRSVRLRNEVGISTDDSYMGVIVQEEVPAGIGGVMVTRNPMNRADFRNVYVNVSAKSVADVVQGLELPYQYLFNTVEGGGRTISIGNAESDLSTEQKKMLQKLAISGRLLQSHFSPDYTFTSPLDIEWLVNSEGIFILQLRPYSK
ncbi:MAG: phosphoenolpyruvate synthase [Bdellovibrionales bacterium GWB1_55_8]|nr:MAG: phosphoenolpyruvate synthase [Bdellovibrionales bacterium GWB1_55_8]